MKKILLLLSWLFIINGHPTGEKQLLTTNLYPPDPPSMYQAQPAVAIDLSQVDPGYNPYQRRTLEQEMSELKDTLHVRFNSLKKEIRQAKGCSAAAILTASLSLVSLGVLLFNYPFNS